MGRGQLDIHPPNLKIGGRDVSPPSPSRIDALVAWTEQCKEAFDELKRRLTTAPVLAYPIASGKFTLDTDASEKGIGAVLSQEQNGQERVAAYFSRSLNRRERNYCVTRKELLAVVKATEKFHYYLYGQRFVVRTDLNF